MEFYGLQLAGRRSTWPSKITFASRMAGFACAMQDQYEAWPSWAWAIEVSVSPFFTVNFVVARAEETVAGRKTCEPALMWFASRIAGLTESNSCQRSPLPKFCSAIFQSESPGLTITAWSLAALPGATGTGAAGATAAGAPEGSGATRTAGGREGGSLGGAKKTRGRSNGERFTGDR